MREASAKKFLGCWKCDFYQLFKSEERSSPHGFITTYREMKKIHEKLGNADGIEQDIPAEVRMKDAPIDNSCGCRNLDNDAASSRSADACDQKN